MVLCRCLLSSMGCQPGLQRNRARVSGHLAWDRPRMNSPSYEGLILDSNMACGHSYVGGDLSRIAVIVSTRGGTL